MVSLKREGGVSLPELMAATGWQAHSVRGFLSGAVGKKMGLAVVSTKQEDGTRVYSLAISIVSRSTRPPGSKPLRAFFVVRGFGLLLSRERAMNGANRRRG